MSVNHAKHCTGNLSLIDMLCHVYSECSLCSVRREGALKHDLNREV